MSQRKTHTAEFKAKVALEAIRGEKTSSQIASQYQVHPVQISQWKKQLLEHSTEIFKSPSKRVKKETGPTPEELFSQIGQMKVEIDWMKKKAAELERYQ